ncbi:2,4-dienoyl-CoA reductase [Polycladomyces subterraneus]|uniref:2,4-dienoyl-CoA reductase n=1 Tax=Polycladomyces subterraneus TaxID=1016997 RepID=A0ABT8IKL9_9BACL|nr:2,4-dienoyl-CoA reductase [Polycladomyces subterraneus]MDN4593101.1 2,4-dienoyl-CoA reductase [Polycladomyces subterraneus]
MTVENRVVIVTGGSSGIGKGIARVLCEKGYRVAITGRDAEKLERARSEIEKSDGQVLTIPMDVRNVEQVGEMIRRTKESFGQIDGLVNNAAGNFLVKAEELSLNGWKAVIDIVLNGTWYCTQALAKEWIADGTRGSIVNIVATYAWTGAAGVVHSAAAKAGVLAMSRSLAVEWGSRYGIRINCVAPGPIENTGGTEKLIASEQAYRHLLQTIPAKRLGRPEEVGNLVAFLLSPEAEYINGDCVTIDAGFWMTGSRLM